MNISELVKKLQQALNSQGEKLTVDGDLGPVTSSKADSYDITITAKKKTPPVDSEKKSPPWYLAALPFLGKKETDPEFAKKMIPKWSLFGMNLGTISQSWAAWCGLAMAVALSAVGVDYAKNGALARNWATYGVVIDWKKDGIPQGAIIHINHGLNCNSSSSNHVAQANGDCTAADLLKSGGTIDLYGGNQGNTWKVSTYSAKEICNVRWPKDVKDYPKPGPILKSNKCTSKGASEPTTRLELNWESSPERKPWSDQIIKNVKSNIALYDSAKDVVEICPKYKSLTEDQRLKALGEFWVAVAYYESSYNPKSYSVDVGNQNNKETWSVGLYQMSGVDSAAKVFNANFTTLQDPIVNINVATEQMRRQLTNAGLLFLPNSSKYRYWAVLLVGNKYSKIPEIKSRVLKYAAFCA